MAFYACMYFAALRPAEVVGLRDRVESLGGTISVRSPRGEGTAVEVALPLHGDRQAPDNPHDAPRRSAPATGRVV